jgi:hypothetical protein
MIGGAFLVAFGLTGYSHLCGAVLFVALGTA